MSACVISLIFMCRLYVWDIGFVPKLHWWKNLLIESFGLKILDFIVGHALTLFTPRW